MDLTKQQIVKILRRAGLPDAAAVAAQTLADHVTPAQMDQFCTQYGLSHGALMGRMGSSP